MSHPLVWLSVPQRIIDAHVDDIRIWEAKQALRQVLINLVSNPEVSAEFRNQWMDFWAAVAEGRELPKVGPIELKGSEGLLNWFAQQGMPRAALARMREGERARKAKRDAEADTGPQETSPIGLEGGGI